MSSELKIDEYISVYGPDDDNDLKVNVIFPKGIGWCYFTKQDLLEMLKMFEGEE